MFETILSFIIKFKYIFIFYLAIILFLIFKRKSLEFQAKIIVLYRTKFGLKFIEKFSTKLREWVILLGYIGIGVGYVGMFFIAYTLIKNLYDLIAVPSAVSGVSLVLPGVNIPGVGILPFWHWLIAIFVIALVHEFSHGIVARAHGIPVKNTGIAFFGPIIGAFVEPDEKKMSKKSDIKQYSVLAAGPFSNILLAFIALALMSLIFVPWQTSMEEPIGFTFGNYYNQNLSYPIAQAGVLPNTIINGVNGNPLTEYQQFNDKLFCMAPGEKIELQTKNGTYDFILAASPDNPEKGFMGINEIKNEFEVKEGYASGFGKVIHSIVSNIVEFLRWLFLLSLGIGLFNLLPLPIVDGGRMIQVTMHRLKGKEKGEKYYRRIGIFFLLVLLFILVFPFLIKLLF